MAVSFRPKKPDNGEVIPLINPSQRILGLDETNVVKTLVAAVAVGVVGDELMGILRVIVVCCSCC
jgi:hypothetical protein